MTSLESEQVFLPSAIDCLITQANYSQYGCITIYYVFNLYCAIQRCPYDTNEEACQYNTIGWKYYIHVYIY